VHLSILHARAVPCTQKQVSFSYFFVGSVDALAVPVTDAQYEAQQNEPKNTSNG